MVKPDSTLFLKALLVLIGFAVLSFCLIVIPEETDFAHVGVFLPILVVIYLSTIPFFFALYQAWKLLGYVGTNQAFSDLSVAALKYIKYSALAFGAMYGLLLPLVFWMAQIGDAPGVAAIGLILVCGALVAATFAAVLQKLVQSGIDLKSENDLTV